ncbi:NaeI family type II restriction endonuclease [Streptomyces sp. NPDC005012]|uniref:NaeI family type II restriction endonuclease n=1 Tax=Streptomyces sp. NPDC005012 TaxID=3154558 RepID=UPI0033AC6F6C
MLPFDEDLGAAAYISASASSAVDPELVKVRDQILSLDPFGHRFARTLRETIDQLLNGEVTGRYDWKTLFKTEKTHAGTLVEINLQREFGFGDGVEMDYRIAGVDVDCKFSQTFGSWMIPPEALGHLCLVVWADDYQTLWSAGLVRILPELLNEGNNRDRKITISARNRQRIHWIWHRAPLPENVLLHLPPETRSAILSLPSGQRRVNELFRRVQQRRIGRGVVRTVAQQYDYMARIREAKGRARTVLREEGILVVGHYEKHQEIARTLGVPVPRSGELVSFRVVGAKARHGAAPRVVLDCREWVLADDNDPQEPGPLLPRHTAG